MKNEENTQAVMRIWHQTSQDRPFTTRLFRQADCAIYILDLTKDPEQTKEKVCLVNKLLDEECHSNLVRILVGNKMDLEEERLVSKTAGIEIARTTGMDRFVETSATQNINIVKTIEAVLNTIRKKGYKRASPSQATISLLSSSGNIS